MIEYKDILEGKSVCYSHWLTENNTKRKQCKIFKWATHFTEYASLSIKVQALNVVLKCTFENIGHTCKK